MLIWIILTDANYRCIHTSILLKKCLHCIQNQRIWIELGIIFLYGVCCTTLHIFVNPFHCAPTSFPVHPPLSLYTHPFPCAPTTFPVHTLLSVCTHFFLCSTANNTATRYRFEQTIQPQFMVVNPCLMLSMLSRMLCVCCTWKQHAYTFCTTQAENVSQPYKKQWPWVHTQNITNHLI